MIDGPLPDPEAAERMAIWDALPAAYREWLADYPRGLKADGCAYVLNMHGGDIEAAKRYIERKMPVPDWQRAPLVAFRRRIARRVR